MSNVIGLINLDEIKKTLNQDFLYKLTKFKDYVIVKLKGFSRLPNQIIMPFQADFV